MTQLNNKRMRNSLVTALGVITCLALTSCRTTIIRTEGESGPQIGSPLRALNPTTFRVNSFRDLRGVADGCLVGAVNADRFKTDIPVADVVKRALERELQRNGHLTTLSEGSKADIVLDGSVFNYWLSFDVGMYNGKASAHAGVEITVTVADKPGVSLQKKYQGEYTVPYGMWGINRDSCEQVVNGALFRMVRDMTTDSAFLDIIRTGAPSSDPSSPHK